MNFINLHKLHTSNTNLKSVRFATCYLPCPLPINKFNEAVSLQFEFFSEVEKCFYAMEQGSIRIVIRNKYKKYEWG